MGVGCAFGHADRKITIIPSFFECLLAWSAFWGSVVQRGFGKCRCGGGDEDRFVKAYPHPEWLSIILYIHLFYSLLLFLYAELIKANAFYMGGGGAHATGKVTWRGQEMVSWSETYSTVGGSRKLAGSYALGFHLRPDILLYTLWRLAIILMDICILATAVGLNSECDMSCRPKFSAAATAPPPPVLTASPGPTLTFNTVCGQYNEAGSSSDDTLTVDTSGLFTYQSSTGCVIEGVMAFNQYNQATPMITRSNCSSNLVISPIIFSYPNYPGGYFRYANFPSKKTLGRLNSKACQALAMSNICGTYTAVYNGETYSLALDAAGRFTFQDGNNYIVRSPQPPACTVNAQYSLPPDPAAAIQPAYKFTPGNVISSSCSNSAPNFIWQGYDDATHRYSQVTLGTSWLWKQAPAMARSSSDLCNVTAAADADGGSSSGVVAGLMAAALVLFVIGNAALIYYCYFKKNGVGSSGDQGGANKLEAILDHDHGMDDSSATNNQQAPMQAAGTHHCQYPSVVAQPPGMDSDI